MDKKLAVEVIKKLELEKRKHYVIFIPLATGITIETAEYMQEDLRAQGIHNVMFVVMKNTEGIKVVENKEYGKSGRKKQTK